MFKLFIKHLWSNNQLFLIKGSTVEIWNQLGPLTVLTQYHYHIQKQVERSIREHLCVGWKKVGNLVFVSVCQQHAPQSTQHRLQAYIKDTCAFLKGNKQGFPFIRSIGVRSLVCVSNHFCRTLLTEPSILIHVKHEEVDKKKTGPQFPFAEYFQKGHQGPKFIRMT